MTPLQSQAAELAEKIEKLYGHNPLSSLRGELISLLETALKRREAENELLKANISSDMRNQLDKSEYFAHLAGLEAERDRWRGLCSDLAAKLKLFNLGELREGNKVQWTYTKDFYDSMLRLFAAYDAACKEGRKHE